MRKVKIKGKICLLKFGLYPNNTVAIECYHDEKRWLVATVNWESNFEGENYAETFQLPFVVIKNYSENEGVFEELLSAGVISIGPYLSGSAGTVQVGKLTKKWQKIARKDLENIK
jgi:hypothetical protein